MQDRTMFAQNAVSRLAENLSHLNPQAILTRGYSIARDANGEVVRDSSAINAGSEVQMTFARGAARAKVISKSS